MVNFEYFPATARASTVAIEMAGRRRSLAGDYIPQNVLIVGQYDQAETPDEYAPVQVFTADEVGTLMGYGSELHRQAIWVFQQLGGFSEGVYIMPVAQPGGSANADGTIIFTGTATTPGTLYFSIGGDLLALNVPVGMTHLEAGVALAEAITAAVALAVTGANITGTVTLTSKFTGVNGNEIGVVLNPAGDTQSTQNPEGLTVTLPVSGYLTGGTGNPDVESVFFDSGADNLQDRWYTILSCPYTDATALDHYNTAGDARANPAVKRPFSAYAGYVADTYNEAFLVPAAINSKWVSPTWESRSMSPAFELAASVVGAVMASNIIDPGRPYKTLPLGIPIDVTVSNRQYVENDALFRAGMGYCKVDGAGRLRIGDLATSYRTNAGGASTEEWFDSVSVHRRQQKVYSIDQLFNSEPYIRGMLGSDDVVTGKAYVIKPKTVITDLMNLVDVWAAEGWTKNPDDVKTSIVADINAGNNSRVDAQVVDDEAQALRIIAVKYAFLY